MYGVCFGQMVLLILDDICEVKEGNMYSQGSHPHFYIHCLKQWISRVMKGWPKDRRDF